jgi:hypothetical protein
MHRVVANKDLPPGTFPWDENLTRRGGADLGRVGERGEVGPWR